MHARSQLESTVSRDVRGEVSLIKSSAYKNQNQATYPSPFVRNLQEKPMSALDQTKVVRIGKALDETTFISIVISHKKPYDLKSVL